MIEIKHLLLVLLICTSILGNSQLYYFENNGLHELTLNGNSCSSSFVGSFVNSANGNTLVTNDIAICPNGKLYVNDSRNTYEVDPLTAISTEVATTPLFPNIVGLGCTIDNELYAVGFGGLFSIDVVSGTTTLVGSIPFEPSGDIVFLDGNSYMSSIEGIVQVNIGNPSLSTLLFSTPVYTGLTVLADDCNSLLAGGNNVLTKIDLATGDQTIICTTIYPSGLTTAAEFLPLPACPFLIDLDENDDSGATQFDFNCNTINCLTENAQNIADSDTKIIARFPIDNITVSISLGIQSPSNEKLISTLAVPNITVYGSGTESITLASSGSAATVSNFETALKAIKYQFDAVIYTNGIREITTLATNNSGDVSNIAISFIEVQDLPKIDLELGPDLEKCENEEITISSNISFLNYEWSTGEISESIKVTSSGNYSLIVTNGIDCPNFDFIRVINNPSYTLSISDGDTICAGGKVLVAFNTNYYDPINVTLINQNGKEFNFNNVNNGYLLDVPDTTSTYILKNYTATETECLIALNDTSIILIAPSYFDTIHIPICKGDSVFIKDKWIKEKGIHKNLFFSKFGCDSTVTNIIDILKIDTIQQFVKTCDLSEIGIKYAKLKNKSNCDSIVVKNYIYSIADTTFLYKTTCQFDLSGFFKDTFKNKNGCDSIVLTNVNFVDSDSTFRDKKTCDVNQVGIFIQSLQSQEGCDSIIITNVKYVESDSTFIVKKTCDISQKGIFMQSLQSQEGCDSIIITNVKYVESDSTFIAKKTCDISQIGIFMQSLQSQEGCDSIIITNVKYVESDSTFIAKKTCDISQIGIFMQSFQSQEGCDSIIITNVKYVESDSTYIEKKSCDINQIGIFMQSYQSNEGCDSIVITSVKYVEPDSTYIEKKSCDINQIGIFIQALQSTEGCDSIVITSVKYVESDSTYIEKKSCDINEIGIFIQSIQSMEGCDSIVITNVKYVEVDSIHINRKTCDLSQAGIFLQTFQSQDGCDSIVLTNVVFIKSDTIIQSLSTCVESEAGSSILILKNINGCDSIINIEINYLGSLSKNYVSYTCNESEIGVKDILLKNVNGCDSMVVLEVKLLPSDSCTSKIEYYFPNIINLQNEVNKIFTIYSNNENATIESLEIFDRWSNKVYQNRNFPCNRIEHGWDATFDGQKIRSGVFVYLCKVNDGKSIRNIIGSVTIIE